MIEAFPIQWPVGWPRTEKNDRVRAHFSKQVVRSLAVVRDELLNELKLLGANPESVVINSNMRLRKDGLPVSGQAQPDDVGGDIEQFHQIQAAYQEFKRERGIS